MRNSPLNVSICSFIYLFCCKTFATLTTIDWSKMDTWPLWVSQILSQRTDTQSHLVSKNGWRWATCKMSVDAGQATRHPLFGKRQRNDNEEWQKQEKRNKGQEIMGVEGRGRERLQACSGFLTAFITDSSFFRGIGFVRFTWILIMKSFFCLSWVELFCYLKPKEPKIKQSTQQNREIVTLHVHEYRNSETAGFTSV